MNWIVQVLKKMRGLVDGRLEKYVGCEKWVVRVKEVAQRGDVRNVRKGMKNVVHGGSVSCNSWAVDRITGCNNTTYSGSAQDFWWKCRRVRFSDLEFSSTL